MTHTATSNGTSATPQLRDKVQFSTNVPQRLTLEFDPPEEPRAGRFGDQYMYFFAGNKIAWFDPPVHAQIVASGAHAGEEIEICKRELKKGNRKHVTWEIVVIGDEPAEFSGPHAEYDPDYAPDTKPPARPAAPAPAPATTNELAKALMLAVHAGAIAGLDLTEDAIVRLAITAYIQATGGKQARA